MATGEYDFSGQFHVSPGGESEEQDELAYLPITTAIWVIFIAVMPVLFINMLVGVRDLYICTDSFAFPDWQYQRLHVLLPYRLVSLWVMLWRY